MYQITLSEFPEKLRMLVSQAQLTGDRLEITQDGETVAVISPVTRRKRAKFGMMKSRTRVLGDIVEPTSDLVDWRSPPGVSRR